jgi:hypothetical protein
MSEFIFIISFGSGPCSHIVGTGIKRILVLFLIPSSFEDKFVS